MRPLITGEYGYDKVNVQDEDHDQASLLNHVRRIAALRKECPEIGLGSWSITDSSSGQVLVMQDMLGISKEFKPRFLRRYADLHTVITDAVSKYIIDIKAKEFPNDLEKY